MKKVTMLSLLLLIVCAQPALAIDVWGGSPEWTRGEPGSTYQKFDMSTPIGGQNPANINENPFGGATIEMEGIWEWDIIPGPAGDGSTVDAWHSMGDGMEGGTSILKITVPNAQSPNPIKKIFLQITSTKGPTSITTVGHGPAGPYTPGTWQTNKPQVQHPGGYQGLPWYTYNYGLTISPNPESEDIFVEIPYCGWVDQIDIDTICTIPEPSTLAMLSLGGFALLTRKRN